MARHNFSVWRSPVPQGWTLMIRCSCGYSAEGLRDYDEATCLVQDHIDEAARLEELEREEAEHA